MAPRLISRCHFWASHWRSSTCQFQSVSVSTYFKPRHVPGCVIPIYWDAQRESCQAKCLFFSIDLCSTWSFFCFRSVSTLLDFSLQEVIFQKTTPTETQQKPSSFPTAWPYGAPPKSRWCLVHLQAFFCSCKKTTPLLIDVSWDMDIMDIFNVFLVIYVDFDFMFVFKDVSVMISESRVVFPFLDVFVFFSRRFNQPFFS